METTEAWSLLDERWLLLMIRVLRRLLLITAAVLTHSAAALTLDWNKVSWTAGTLTQSYDIDPASPGNDVTVTITGNTSQLTLDGSGNTQTPYISSQIEGGMGAGTKTLDLAADFANLTQSVTVTVTFSSAYAQGAKNVSFSIFDVDYSNVNGNGGAKFEDQIRSIIGTTSGNASVAPAVTGSADNSVTGSGTLTAKITGTVTSVDAGTGSNAANATVNFGSTAIRSFTFAYGNGTALPSNTDPTRQHIGLYNINFTPVPEINPALASAFSCGAALLLTLFHRGRVRNKTR